MNQLMRMSVCAALVALCSSPDAIAGLVRVHCDPGTSVGIAWTDDEKGIQGAGASDTNGDGVVEFGIPRQDHVKYGVSISKVSDGRVISYRLDLNVGGVTVASLEPFATPTFGAVATESALVAVIDIAGFLQEGNPFTVGQVLTVTNGAIPQTDKITFKDVTGVTFSPEDLLNPSFLSGLPNFSGQAAVKPFDTYTEHGVPTVSEWGLIVLTLLLLTAGTILVARRRRPVAA